MCGFSCKKKERKVLNSSLYSLTHRNARILKLVSLRVRRIRLSSFYIVSILMRFVLPDWPFVRPPVTITISPSLRPRTFLVSFTAE